MPNLRPLGHIVHVEKFVVVVGGGVKSNFSDHPRTPSTG